MSHLVNFSTLQFRKAAQPGFLGCNFRADSRKNQIPPSARPSAIPDQAIVQYTWFFDLKLWVL